MKNLDLLNDVVALTIYIQLFSYKIFLSLSKQIATFVFNHSFFILLIKISSRYNFFYFSQLIKLDSFCIDFNVRLSDGLNSLFSNFSSHTFP